MFWYPLPPRCRGHIGSADVDGIGQCVDCEAHRQVADLRRQVQALERDRNALGFTDDDVASASAAVARLRRKMWPLGYALGDEQLIRETLDAISARRRSGLVKASDANDAQGMEGRRWVGMARDQYGSGKR